MSTLILAAEPQLFVSDLEASLSYYVERLGFSVAFSQGAPAFYAQVARGGARLNLRHVAGPVFDPRFRARERDALSATIPVSGIQDLFREFEAAGVGFHQAMKVETWGAITFIVRDPDGNLIAFAGPAS